MIIYRNGNEIELASDEMQRAFWEQQREFDTEDILYVIQELEDDGRIKRLSDEEDLDLAESLAERYRETLGEHGYYRDIELQVAEDLIRGR